MRLDHSELLTARAISHDDLRSLLPDCSFLQRLSGAPEDRRGRSRRSHWEELEPFETEVPEAPDFGD